MHDDVAQALDVTPEQPVLCFSSLVANTPIKLLNGLL